MGSSRVRPTLETRFHIDYDWWKRDERDLRMYLISHLAPERQELFRDAEQDEQIDWVDPETAEVRRIDALQRELQTAAQSEDFITSQTSLVDAVFRLFLANGNTPLTPVEIGEELGRPPQMILKTLAGGRVYKGIRPVAD
jgi:hypothetical protein